MNFFAFDVIIRKVYSGFPQCDDFPWQKGKLRGRGVSINSIYYAAFLLVYFFFLLSIPIPYKGSTMQITCGSPGSNANWLSSASPFPLISGRGWCILRRVYQSNVIFGLWTTNLVLIQSSKEGNSLENCLRQI